MHIPSIISLLGAAALTSAAKLTINIPPNSPALPNPATLPASTHAVLIGAPGTKFSAPLRRDNTFVFSSLPEASYLLEIHSRDHFFAPYRVDVGHTAGESAQQETVHVWQTFRGNEWSNKGPHLGSANDELRIDVRPAAQKDFYQPRGGFSVMSIFKNPMILMGLVSVVMIFGMPYLMENSTFSWKRRSGGGLYYEDGFTDFISQWTKRRRRRWKRCSRARSAVLRVRPRRFRTSIWLASCLASLRLLRLGRRRRSERDREPNECKDTHNSRLLGIFTSIFSRSNSNHSADAGPMSCQSTTFSEPALHISSSFVPTHTVCISALLFCAPAAVLTIHLIMIFLLPLNSFSLKWSKRRVPDNTILILIHTAIHKAGQASAWKMKSLARIDQQLVSTSWHQSKLV